MRRQHLTWSIPPRAHSRATLRLGGGPPGGPRHRVAAMPEAALLPGWLDFSDARKSIRLALAAEQVQEHACCQEQLPQAGQAAGHPRAPPILPNAVRAPVLHGLHRGRPIARLARQTHWR